MEYTPHHEEEFSVRCPRRADDLLEYNRSLLAQCEIDSLRSEVLNLRLERDTLRKIVLDEKNERNTRRSLQGDTEMKIYLLWKMWDYSEPELILVCATEESVKREMEKHIQQDIEKKNWMLQKITPEKLRKIVSADYYFDEMQVIN
jgi:hypothetical protein